MASAPYVDGRHCDICNVQGVFDREVRCRLREYCDEYGMQVNEKKTEFMVINGNKSDREKINVNGMSQSLHQLCLSGGDLH